MPAEAKKIFFEYNGWYTRIVVKKNIITYFNNTVSIISYQRIWILKT